MVVKGVSKTISRFLSNESLLGVILTFTRMLLKVNFNLFIKNNAEEQMEILKRKTAEKIVKRNERRRMAINK